jgi:ornithine carbamoyltransferase
MIRHFRHLFDLSAAELAEVLQRASELRRRRRGGEAEGPVTGKSVLILLEKASTRTRLSFEVGIRELGGQPIVVLARDSQLGRGEPIADTARVFSGYADAVVYRTFGQDRLDALAASSSIPVVNALTDRFHPCQLLADLQTVREAFGTLADVPVAWVGDGNNMAHSWLYAAALTGLELRVATPPDYEVEASVLAKAEQAGAKVAITHDPAEAVDGARVVTTDVWTSMGQEAENAARMKAFQGFQVDGALMAKAAPDAIFLHCLPAHRGEEVAAEVIDGPASRVWEEAENRLHAQKALLELLLG